MKKKKLNQTQALAMWMKSGKWIDLNIARKELGITRLPEIIHRLKYIIHFGDWSPLIEEKNVTIETIYGKTHIKRWRVIPKWMSKYKPFIREFYK